MNIGETLLKIRAKKIRFFDIVQSLMSHITKSISGALSFLLLVTLISFGTGLLAPGIPASASSNCYWQAVPGQPGNFTLEGDLSNCVIGPAVPLGPFPEPAPSATPTVAPAPVVTVAPAPVVTVAPAPVVTVAPAPVVVPTPTPTPTLNAEAIAKADAAEKVKKAADALAKLQTAAADLAKANLLLQQANDEAQAALDKISPRTAVTVALAATSAKINENSPAKLVATLSEAKATGSVSFILEVTGRPELKRELCSGSIVDSSGIASCNFFTLVNLTNQESYKITAKYSGDANYATFETAITFTVSKLEVIKPCTPDLETLSTGDSTITLSIDPVVNSRCGLPTSYQVREFTSERVLCETTSLSCSLTGLTNGTSVEFYLVAINSARTSNPVPSSRKKIVGNPVGKPLPPALATARTMNSSKIRVTWQGGATDGGSPLTSFVATSNDGSLQCSNLLTLPAEQEANIFSCDVSKPLAGQKYSFTVKAVNKFGSSVASVPTNEVATSATAIENFEHRILVLGGFVVKSINLRELGNSENQVTCVRASSCSLVVPKGGKWSYSIEDEFAHQITDSKTNLQVAGNESLDSISDTNLVIFTEQEKSLIVSGRTNTKISLVGPFTYANAILEVGAYAVVAPLFTPRVEPVQDAFNLGVKYAFPQGMNFINGRYFGIPTNRETVSDLYKIDGIEVGIFFNITEFSYAAPDSVSLTANGNEVSYLIKPSSSDTLSDVTNRADKWEVAFFNQSNQFLSKTCSSTLTGKVMLPESPGLYAKAFSGCSEMKESKYNNYKISSSSVASNTVSTIRTITFAALSGLNSKIVNKYEGKILNLSFTIQPNEKFVLVPSSPMKVSLEEISKFASLMNGLTIDSVGKITGSIAPVMSGIFASSSWTKSVKIGGYDVYFDVTLTLSTLNAGQLSIVKVDVPAANSPQSFGKIEFNYKPSYVGNYRLTLEMETIPYTYSDLSDARCSQADKSKGCVVILALATQELNFTSLLPSSNKVISFSSKGIDLPGFVKNSQTQELYQPYNLPIAAKYRIRVEAINVSVTPGNIYLDKSAVNYSSNIDLVWPRKSAPKPSAPLVEATSKSGEIAVGGWVSSIWNYPEEPVSISVVACPENTSAKCTTTVFDSFEEIVNSMGSKGTLLIKGLKNEKYKVWLTFNMDPKSIEYKTGPSSGFSGVVKPKK